VVMIVVVVVAIAVAMIMPVAMVMVVAVVVTAVVMTKPGGSEVVPEGRHRQQMDGQYAAHYATHHPDIALDRHTVAHHSSVHVSFSAFDTVGTRDGFIDGGMLRRQLYTAAVERSRVNFPEYADTSPLNDKPLPSHGNLDHECRLLTQDVSLSTQDVPLSENFRSK